MDRKKSIALMDRRGSSASGLLERRSAVVAAVSPNGVVEETDSRAVSPLKQSGVVWFRRKRSNEGIKGEFRKGSLDYHETMWWQAQCRPTRKVLFFLLLFSSMKKGKLMACWSCLRLGIRAHEAHVRCDYGHIRSSKEVARFSRQLGCAQDPQDEK